MIKWTIRDSKRAMKEGWNIHYCAGSECGEWQLQKDDEMNLFDADYLALEFVLKKAIHGSNLHKKAIAYLALNNPLELIFINFKLLQGITFEKLNYEIYEN